MSIVDEKLELLRIIEDAFDAFAAEEFQTVCGPRCAVCCTRDVTATALEARRMIAALEKAGRRDLLDKLADAAAGDLFRPKVTTNAMAMAIMTGQDPPEEEPGRGGDACLFLEDGLCAVYESRPFTCRGMFSALVCRPGSEAEAPDLLATLVPTCWQIIEHLDAGGLYGNLIDLMLHLSNESVAARYDAGERLQTRGVPPTRPVPGLLVPPEHQEKMAGFLGRLFETPRGNRTFRQAMGDMRNSPF